MSANGREIHTVKEVAKLSGVSVRTLHFYDEIGLLKPSFYGDNGYRYYEKEQLLILQQALFYRELGFELAMVRKIMCSPGFDKVAALRSHRDHLATEAERTKELICTIDKTLAHLEREIPMKENEMYVGFDPKKEAEFERYAIERWGGPAREKIEESKRRTKDWGKKDYEKVKQGYNELHGLFVAGIERGLPPGDAEIQELTKRHCAVVNRFWTPTRQTYSGLARTYREIPEFRKMYDGCHPKLADYLAEAMRIFAETNLE